MSGFEDLKDLFRRRLLAAGDSKGTGYEEELQRQRKVLQVILTPEIKLRRAELPLEQQERSTGMDQEDTYSPIIKEEQEELWLSPEEEHFKGLEETVGTMISFSPVSVKSEDDDETPQISQLSQIQTELIESEADGEDYGGPEHTRSLDPEGHLKPVTEVKTKDSSEPETEDSDNEQLDTREHHTSLSSVNFEDKGPENNKNIYICSECGKEFEKEWKMVKHMRIHTSSGPFSCPECEKKFNCRRNLTAHMRLHTGEKPFSCSECGKSFNQSGQLNRHKRVHTGEKPFSCAECGKKFNQSGQLRLHMRIHTGEKPFSCSECGKSFYCKENLTRHVRIHTGEKPYRCSECGQNFTQSAHLSVHMKSHTGEKLFSCSACGQRFQNKQNLDIHMLDHSEEKLSSCSECGRSFDSTQSLSGDMFDHNSEMNFSCSACSQRFSC